MFEEYIRGIPYNVIFDPFIYLFMPITLTDLLLDPNGKPTLGTIYDKSNFI